MVGGSIVVLFKWCSIVIALYIMRTFSPNSGSVFWCFLSLPLVMLLFKWCSVCIAVYIMRTFSPSSGSVFCGLLVCLVLSCCVCCLQLNESSCSCLNCLVVCWLYLTNCLLYCVGCTSAYVLLYLLFVCLAGVKT